MTPPPPPPGTLVRLYWRPVLLWSSPLSVGVGQAPQCSVSRSRVSVFSRLTSCLLATTVRMYSDPISPFCVHSLALRCVALHCIVFLCVCVHLGCVALRCIPVGVSGESSLGRRRGLHVLQQILAWADESSTSTPAAEPEPEPSSSPPPPPPPQFRPSDKGLFSRCRRYVCRG